MEKRYSFQQIVLEQLLSICKKEKRILPKSHTLYSKLFQSSCRLSIKHETVKSFRGKHRR